VRENCKKAAAMPQLKGLINFFVRFEGEAFPWNSGFGPPPETARGSRPACISEAAEGQSEPQARLYVIVFQSLRYAAFPVGGSPIGFDAPVHAQEISGRPALLSPVTVPPFAGARSYLSRLLPVPFLILGLNQCIHFIRTDTHTLRLLHPMVSFSLKSAVVTADAAPDAIPATL
jgi:hypothetical protein